MLEVDVTEVGASLKWATVTVSKATRTNGTTSAPAEPANGQAAEPPF